MALACSLCPCNFCGWCGADCGGDAHAHVRGCSQRAPGLQDPYFVRFDTFEQHHRRRWGREVETYLQSLEASLRARVKGAIRRDLQDLGIGG